MAAGYVDDGRFAEARAARLAERGLGDEAIRHDLEGRGIETELAERVLAGLEPEVERAGRVAERAGGGLRAARTLARKGFAAETVEAVAHRARSELGCDYTI